MAVTTHGTSSNYLQRAPSPTGLADVVDLILDKGLVIDAFVRVAVIGIELVTIDARIVIASVDTYLRFAEAVNRLDLMQTETAGINELRDGGDKSKGKGEGMAKGAKEAFSGNGKERRVAAAPELPPYAYAVVRGAASPPACRGVLEAPVATVGAGDVAPLVSRPCS